MRSVGAVRLADDRDDCTRYLDAEVPVASGADGCRGNPEILGGGRTPVVFKATPAPRHDTQASQAGRRFNGQGIGSVYPRLLFLQ